MEPAVVTRLFVGGVAVVVFIVGGLRCCAAPCYMAWRERRAAERRRQEVESTGRVLLAGDGEAELEQCMICCEENIAPEEELRFLPCSHGFHKQCIDKWRLQFSLACPLCRSQ
uniref:RING-type domain-containing protein n=1 Tax=Oryza brachyantha TaxID=4533 RepID=J3N2L9_ORYBR